MRVLGCRGSCEGGWLWADAQRWPRRGRRAAQRKQRQQVPRSWGGLYWGGGTGVVLLGCCGWRVYPPGLALFLSTRHKNALRFQQASLRGLTCPLPLTPACPFTRLDVVRARLLGDAYQWQSLLSDTQSVYTARSGAINHTRGAECTAITLVYDFREASDPCSQYAMTHPSRERQADTCFSPHGCTDVNCKSLHFPVHVARRL